MSGLFVMYGVSCIVLCIATVAPDSLLGLLGLRAGPAEPTVSEPTLAECMAANNARLKEIEVALHMYMSDGGVKIDSASSDSPMELESIFMEPNGFACAVHGETGFAK